MLLIGRLVPADGDWLVSGHLTSYPSSAREHVLAIAAGQAMRIPEAVFRNPAKLAEARRMLAGHQAVFAGRLIDHAPRFRGNAWRPAYGHRRHPRPICHAPGALDWLRPNVQP